jgi:hypothetical protein
VGIRSNDGGLERNKSHMSNLRNGGENQNERLIFKYLQKKYPNLTNSEIVERFWRSHGEERFLNQTISKEDLQLLEKIEIRKAAENPAKYDWSAEFPETALMPLLYNCQTQAEEIPDTIDFRMEPAMTNAILSKTKKGKKRCTEASVYGRIIQNELTREEVLPLGENESDLEGVLAKYKELELDRVNRLKKTRRKPIQLDRISEVEPKLQEKIRLGTQD